jgi:hypothetical protein
LISTRILAAARTFLPAAQSVRVSWRDYDRAPLEASAAYCSRPASRDQEAHERVTTSCKGAQELREFIGKDVGACSGDTKNSTLDSAIAA